jgi:hypothetical protein
VITLAQACALCSSIWLTTSSEGVAVQDQALASKNESCFYRDKRWPPLSPAPQIPAEAPPLHYGESSFLRMAVDEAEHFPAQSACQRRFAPTTVRLQRNAVRLPAGITVHLRRNPQFSSLSPRRIARSSNSVGVAGETLAGFPLLHPEFIFVERVILRSREVSWTIRRKNLVQ